MPHVTFIYASVGRMLKPGFLRSWQMQPLAIARLAALTPKEWSKVFFDDRMEPIDYDIKTDLVAISIETYTASRGYQIAARFRERKIPVVLGGFHATLCPDESLEHADAICVGEAEPVWAHMLEDARIGCLKGRYAGQKREMFNGLQPDRKIFAGKNYLPIALIETSRGCPFRCNFCSVSAFYNASYRRRPIPAVVEEIRQAGRKHVFFVDDHITADLSSARELFSAIRPLKISWFSQAGLDGLKDESLLKAMAESGCMGLIIGFESLEPKNLARMSKHGNHEEEYTHVIDLLRRAGIFVYGQFIFGYPHDTQETFNNSLDFARREKMFLAAFNPLVPYPGTPLYREIEAGGRLRFSKWWLSDQFTFGQTPFEPLGMRAEETEERCYRMKRSFYHPLSIVQRGADLRRNGWIPKRIFAFIGMNLLARKEIYQRRRFPVGARPTEANENAPVFYPWRHR